MATARINPKLKIKFLRLKTLENTPIEPGNLIVTMDTEEVFFDIFSASGGIKRINVSDFYTVEQINSLLTDYYTKTEIDSLMSKFLTFEILSGSPDTGDNAGESGTGGGNTGNTSNSMTYEILNND